MCSDFRRSESGTEVSAVGLGARELSMEDGAARPGDGHGRGHRLSVPTPALWDPGVS